jgi:alkylation response protein AidB-like acyl-CoA dehydrogenase
MDFTVNDTQRALADLARRVFTDVEAPVRPFDRDLWENLALAGLSSVGTEDGGFLEQCIVLVEQGRAVAPVPLWAHLVASTALGRSAGLVTLAIDDEGVPALDVADQVVVVRGAEVFVVDAASVEGIREETTAGVEFAVDVSKLSGKPVDADAGDLVRRAIVARCAVGVGVVERALEMTAAYTTERKQFDRPLGTFQAVQQRAANAYIDVEAMRLTMWQAAWRISESLDAEHAVAVAKFWAAEGGQRVVSTAQHLHGGMGADIDYPLHRYTLWAKEIELAFGGATQTLARMGEALAR